MSTAYPTLSGGVTLGTLFHMAKAAGWTPPPAPRPALGTRSAARITGGGEPAADQICALEFVGLNLVDIAARPVDQGDTLLGDRYLCRAGVLLFVGASGIGKSTASMQQDIMWSCGLPAFGIIPARPLRILTIQAENDEGDTTEQARGILRGLNLTPEQQELVRTNTVIVFCNDRAGDAFLALLDKLLAKYQPDLVRIDPLNAYAAGDMTKGEVIAQFCRQGLNPILHRHGCGAVIVAHPPKPKDTEGWTTTDWQYSAAGGADLTNWTRAVLTIDHRTGIPGTFRYIAAKRGKRIGWFNEDGSPTVERYFRHSTTGIFWEDVPAVEAPAKKVKPGKAGAESVAALIAADGGCLEKVLLIERCSDQLKMGERRARTLIRLLTGEQGGHYEHRMKRPGKRDAVFISTSSTPPLVASANNADNNANNENNATGKALSAPLFAPANNTNNTNADVAERCLHTPPKGERVTTTTPGPTTPSAPQPAIVEGEL